METGGGEKRQSSRGVPNGRLDSGAVNGRECLRGMWGEMGMKDEALRA